MPALRIPCSLKKLRKENTMNKIAVFILLTLTFSACRSKKIITVAPTPVVLKKDSTAAITAESMLKSTLNQWTYFSSKVELEFTQNGNTTKASAHIRMYKDSLIWISAGMFGVEGYRMLINKDSMVILNKLGRSYQVLSNKSLAGLSDAPLSVSQIQNLLIGKPVFALKFYQLVFGKDSALSITYPQDKFVTSHYYKKTFYTLDSTSIKDKVNSHFVAKYDKYSDVDGINFPIKNEISANSSNNSILLKLEHTDADFITELTFPFTIPASYEKTK